MTNGSKSTSGVSDIPRVLFAITHSDAGGAQEMIVNLAQGFRAAGVHADILALYPSDTLQPSPADMPWHHVVLSRPGGPLAALSLLRALVRELRRARPDVVFTALPAANVMVPIAALLARTGTRVAISHHSQLEGRTPILERIDALTGRLPVVSDVISVSRTVAGSRRRSPAYRRKQRIIMNALPPEIEALVADLVVGREGRQRGRKVVTNGRLVPVKNHPLLVRAAQHLPDVRIEITGGGPDEAMLKALATELHVADRVDFVGQTSRRESLERLADGDVFTQMSLYEGHSLALIEAAKIGLPLIVSNIPVQIESITASDGTICGRIVDIDDDGRLAAEIRRLLDDEDAYREAVALSRKLAGELNYAGMIAAYLDVAGVRPA